MWTCGLAQVLAGSMLVAVNMGTGGCDKNSLAMEATPVGMSGKRKENAIATTDWARGDCTTTGRLRGINGLSDDELRRRFGSPAREDAFRLIERQDEFHVALQNHYPLTVKANQAVQLQEWTWKEGACRLTVWLHKPATAWTALENIRYPAKAEF